MKIFDGRSMAFTIESMCLKVLVYSGKKIETWYSVPIPPNLVRDGVIENIDVVSALITETIEEFNLPRRGVVAAIPSTGSATQTLSLPDIKKGNLDDIVHREIRRVMPGSSDLDLMYWQKLPAEGGIKKQSIYVLAVPKNIVLNFIDLCRESGIKLRGLELKPFALLRAVKCKNGVIVHADLDNIEIVVVHMGFPGLFRSIPTKEAEPTTETASQNLLRELPFTIDYYNKGFRDAELSTDAPIYLSGELSLEPKLAIEISDSSGREVATIEPEIDCPPSFPIAQFQTCVGLMLRSNWY
jgi:hypothetical protein